MVAIGRLGGIACVGGSGLTPYHCQKTKRVFDVVFSVFILAVASPVVLIVIVVAFFAHGRPIFYVSNRYVRPNRHVRIYKFRSMVKDAQSDRLDLKGRFMKQGYLDVPVESGAYTWFGRLLERTQLVELPQVLNVLLDGLSWVGNRALPSENLTLLGQFAGWEERFDSPCGLTGISQVVGKFNLEPIERITLECMYSRVYKCGNILKCDAKIAVATIWLILFDRTLSYDEAVRLLTSCLQQGHGASGSRTDTG